ncbi:hypothetical protein STRIP9103_01692 [Streptomyces ipomoeae 91-03]|uniref:Uncharacterized protein n=1 Tax=Streptomyces ipomoeae 91-03 TaxID=698759 RepID=L1KQ11_9ACTN|nr:hypothetical protein STRIP9103_01692 [Streptomyces ipomoeae 91-03]
MVRARHGGVRRCSRVEISPRRLTRSHTPELGSPHAVKPGVDRPVYQAQNVWCSLHQSGHKGATNIAERGVWAGVRPAARPGSSG